MGFTILPHTLSHVFEKMLKTNDKRGIMSCDYSAFFHSINTLKQFIKRGTKQVWKLYSSSKKAKSSNKKLSEHKCSIINRLKKKFPLKRKHIPYVCLATSGAFLIAVGLYLFFAPELEAAIARNEYQMLREGFSEISNQPTPAIDGEARELAIIEEEQESEEDIVNLSMDDLARINNNFIGWISIRNVIEYPVVRGRDNVRYVNTTFTGRRSSAGAIFMDYRNRSGFDGKVSIIYGHHTWDGSMFSPIARYLDPAFMRRNPNIIITTRDGRTLTYRVFAARLTDAWDPAYTIALFEPDRASSEFPNAPPDANRFLLLSTCTRGGSDDERIIVFAALTS